MRHNKMKNQKPNLVENMRKELKRSRVLADQEKKLWLEQLESVPEILLKQAYEVLRSANAKIDDYLKAALVADKGEQILTAVRNIIKLYTNKALEAEQVGKEDASAEEVLKRLEEI